MFERSIILQCLDLFFVNDNVVILLPGENTRDASLQEAESSNGADPGEGEGHSVHSSGQDEPAATEDRTAARLRGASRGIHTVWGRICITLSPAFDKFA